MKSVLISIQPKWCELIASGKKTSPKLKTPFKVYIYCSKSKNQFLQSRNNMFFYCESRDTLGGHGVGLYCRLNGKVIGEFVCNQIDTYDDDTIYAFSHEDYSKWNDFDLYNCCIHPEDFERYANGNWLYGWHISDLIIYDKPKELSEFHLPCIPECDGLCEYGCLRPLKRPPQSWCYVEELP